ncbi:MAG: hypothetical protein H7256_00690 [Bdellovibrio sp.]|nr:hypothetical protein [Bdellovibrio sp.]
MPYQVPAEFEHLADQVGSFIEFWGFKKIHGQIWTHIWLSSKPIAATVLVKRLGCSKALVSLALKDLIHYKVILVVGQGDRRKILLKANEDVQSVISNVLHLREAKMLESVVHSNEGVKNMPHDQKTLLDLDEDKLDQMKVLVQIAQLSLATVISSQLCCNENEEEN